MKRKNPYACCMNCDIDSRQISPIFLREHDIKPKLTPGAPTLAEMCR